ncbi:MAG: hypothetical protein LUO94_02295 [Methylococcaceae bacterium]|nr:hypothetical protein [Methylococcaceae bacterium]
MAKENQLITMPHLLFLASLISEKNRDSLSLELTIHLQTHVTQDFQSIFEKFAGKDFPISTTHIVYNGE